MTDVATTDPDTGMPDATVLDQIDQTPTASCTNPEPEGGQEPYRYLERPVIPVELLVAHPGNVREDAKASRQFCASVAAIGIIDPLEITPVAGSHLYRVIDGHVRLDAALKVGLTEVPYFFNADTVGDEARQFLHMLITSRLNTNLAPREEATALFQASQSMTRTQIRKATGLAAAEVKAGIQVGKLKAETVQLAEQMDYEWTLEELALLAPFEDDPEAMDRIARECSWGRPLKYTMQLLLDERAAQAQRRTLIDELEAAGTPVTDGRPEGAVPLRDLLDGEQEMTADSHASCPGRIAYFPSWGQEPWLYCADPVAHGHVFTATGTTEPPPPPQPITPSVTRESEKPSTERRIVIEGNKAWKAAAKVRQRWLAGFLTRKSPPKDTAATIARFVTTQLVTMPEPLCRALGNAHYTRLFETFGKPDSETITKSSLAGLWMLALAPIATAYEHEIVGDGERRNTWRQDKYSPCSRQDASAWLQFVADIGAAHGYEPSPIEIAVTDGTPYRGDQPSGGALDTTDTDTDTEETGHDPHADDDTHDDAHDARESAEVPAQAGDPDAPAEPGTAEAGTAQPQESQHSEYTAPADEPEDLAAEMTAGPVSKAIAEAA